MNIIGIDTGYSATKIYSETERNGKKEVKTMIFPSVMGKTDFGEDFLGSDEDNFIAELSLFPGRVGNFGETAIRLNRGGESTIDRDKFTSYYNPVLTLAGLAKFMHEKNVSAPDILVVGLPVNYYLSKRKELVQKLSGNHSIKLYKINGEVLKEIEFKLEPSQILVLPQGYGSYLSYALDAEGKKIPDRLVLTAVIDGGEKTIDIVAANGRFLDSMSKSIPSSLDAVYHSMQRELDDRYDDYLDRTTIESMIREKIPYRTLKMEEVDLEELRTQILNSLIPEIINRVQMTVRSIRPQKVLISGGSGEMLFEGLKEVFPTAEKVESMVFSNSIGYYRYGLLRSASGEVKA